ncbi:glycosyltransferase family protein [Pontibacter ruber]|uniref:Glycosyltransferase family protein n=1 Tax=Pontibacter ruber TaxID=1343895 RepID=A0ABW5CZ12_9BACT|nr:glycosyltransferase family protein [Pontibacter ruber]
MVKVGAIIQVRLGSERLPNKALLPLPFGGGPGLMEHVILRACAATTLQEVVVATTESTTDDAILNFCTPNAIGCFRGSTDDVLDRFMQAASKYKLDVVVRLTGDNPFVNPETIDEAVQQHLEKKADYTITEGLPLGTNVEVISFAALQRAAKEATETADREHVTPYIRREKGFSRQSIAYTSPIQALRLTIDYPSDYALASLLYERLLQDELYVRHEDIAELVAENPWLYAVNAVNTQRQAFASEEDELTEAKKLLQTGGFTRVLQKLQ